MKIKNSKIDKYGCQLIKLDTLEMLLDPRNVTNYTATYQNLNNNTFKIDFLAKNGLINKFKVKKFLMKADIIYVFKVLLQDLNGSDNIALSLKLDSLPDCLITDEQAMQDLLKILDQENKNLVVCVGDYIKERRKQIEEEKQADLDDKYDQLKEEFKF